MRQPPCKLGASPDEKSQTAAAELTVGQPCEKFGVLVVDDEHMVRIMVQLGLERSGFDFWLARNGREVIDLYRRHTNEITVMLLEVRMPGMDGLQTLEVLRELNPEVLACFMSGDTVVYESEELLERGAANFIAKPFRLDDLANILRLMAHHVSADIIRSRWVCHG